MATPGMPWSTALPEVAQPTAPAAVAARSSWLQNAKHPFPNAILAGFVRVLMSAVSLNSKGVAGPAGCEGAIDSFRVWRPERRYRRIPGHFAAMRAAGRTDHVKQGETPRRHLHC
jgi:hypothetical protein